MEENFIKLFRETLEIEDREISVDDAFRDYPEWDSLALLSVIAMIDDEYDIIIEGNDFAKLKTIGELIDTIKKMQA